MKLHQIVNSRVIRFVDQDTTTDAKPRSPVPIIKAMEDRYGFVQVPRTVQELNFNTGVTFLRGYFEDAIIEQLQLYEVGMLCEAKTNSDVCDRFLTDFFTWAVKEFELPFKQKESGSHVYVSQLEVSADLDIGVALSKFSQVGETVARNLQSYGFNFKPFEVSGIKLHTDLVGVPGAIPSELTFERRAQQNYASSVYFSSAPLRTDDHLNVLNELEKIF